MADTETQLETKFDVAPDFELGPLDELTPGPVRTDTVDVTSTYYDTAGQALLRSNLALRQQTDGDEAGWQLSLPATGGRSVLRWPADDDLPAALRELIDPWLAQGAIGPVATLKVTRTRHRLLDTAEELVLAIADDQVRASAPSGSVAAPRWREVEVELGPAGRPADLRRAAALLIERGAFPPATKTKFGRALNGIHAPAEQPDTAGAGIAGYLRAQCDAITAGHFAIADKPFEAAAGTEPHEAVHQTRVATRRLRALLTVFAELFEPAAAARLQAELGWFAAELGEIRDREVLRSRLARAVDDLPAFLVVGPVPQRIDDILLRELRHHAEALKRTMRDARYADLVRDLAHWRTDPPFTAAADQPAAGLEQFVTTAEHKLTRRMKRAADRLAPEEALHSARKAGKRARYAAEATESVLGRRAHRLARTAANLQSLLGEHQDSLVATELLRRVADQVADEGENAFTYGILVADQRRIAADTAAAARDAARDR